MIIEENISIEQVKKSIESAYHSFNLIKNLQAKDSLTEFEKSRININIKHIYLMLNFDWFKNGLTLNQADELYTLVLQEI